MASIGMVLEAEFPPDIRVEKETSALTAAGHEVHLLCIGFGRAPSRERVGTVEVHRARIPRALHRKLHATIVRWPFYLAFWRRLIHRFVTRAGVDVLTIHDLPLARAGLDAGLARDVPVVLDLHESFPEAIRSWGLDRGLLGRHLYDHRRWTAYERACVARAAGVIVVVDEARERLRHIGVASEKSVVVMNTERAEFADGADPVDPGGDPPLRLLYVGGFGPHRGIDTAIDALAELHEDEATVRLVGDGRIRDALLARVRSLALGDRVSFERWVPLDRVRSEIAACHVGIVPHHRSPHTESTVPHKLFQYMLLGRPVIVSDCAPLARIVTSQRCGVIFRSGDAADLARAVRSLADPDVRRELGRNGAIAARGPLAFARDAARLAAFYARVLERGAGSSGTRE